jgi:glycosyltransferase involved in cell wall biosynthesis
MKDLPKISIVIPSFNKKKFIGATLESIFSQNYPNFEVIIQDGASTDGTLEITEKFAKKYPQVVNWESKKDKGQTDAINKGLKKAKGEILTYINADDIYIKGALKKVDHQV